VAGNDVIMTAPFAGDTFADNAGDGSGGPTYSSPAYALHATDGPLDAEELRVVDAWWRAANYLAVGQIYLTGNPLLRAPMGVGDIKPRLLGHWGTTPALNLVYAHANREIVARDLNAVCVMGPGHGGPGPNAAAWLEGAYTERWSHIPLNEEGMGRFFRQFSFPGGVPSHCAPQTPGSFHEGGELGYSLLHAFGAALDNPDLTVFCVIGDGEAETGPLAASWHAKTFLDPARDGAVLPILNLNQYKIANPTMLASMPRAQLKSLLVGYGYDAMFVEGDDPSLAHQAMASTLDTALERIAAIQASARSGEAVEGHRLARHRPGDAERMDGAEDRRRAQGGGNLSRAPGAACLGQGQPRASSRPRGMVAELPSTRTLQ